MNEEFGIQGVLGRCVAGGYTRTVDGHYFRREPGFGYWTLGGARTGTRIAKAADGREFVRSSQTFALTEPRTVYETRHEPGLVESFYVIFAPGPGLSGLLDWPESSAGMRSLTVEDPELLVLARGALESAVDFYQMAHAQGKTLAMAQVLKFLLLVRPAMQVLGNKRVDDRVAQAVRAIHESPGRAWTVEELAKAARMSGSHFAHKFKEDMGLSAVKYAQERRMGLARELLLTTNLSVGEIGERLGFANAFHFSSRFRSVVGRCPRSYRVSP